MLTEGRLSAILVSFLTGLGLTLTLGQAFHDYMMGLAVGVPVFLIMGLVLALFASDGTRKARDEKSPKGE